MSVATNHVGGLQQNTGHRVVNTTALAGDFRLRADHTLLSVVNEGDTLGDTVRDNRTTHEDTVGVHALNPFAVLDANLLGVLGAHPSDRTTTEHAQHVLVVEVLRVDSPLVVRGQVANSNRNTIGRAELGLVVQTGHVQRRTVNRQSLAHFVHPVVVEEEVHTAGQGVERLLLLDVDGERSVAATAGLRTGPLGGGHHGLRCRLGHGEGDTTFLVTFCQVHQVQTGLLLELLEALDSNLTVRSTRNHQDGFGNLHVGVQCGTACALTGVHHTKFLSHLGNFVLQIVGDVLGGRTELVEQRTNGGVHVVQCTVVTLNGDEVRHVLTGNAHHTGGVLPVGCVTAGLSNLAGGVVQQRDRNDVLTNAEVLLSQASELVRQSLEGLVVGLCLPRRVNCRGERVQERVHIGRGDIVLLVPGCSRQNDVRQQGGGGHTEVRGDQQIQLALRCVVNPLHFVRQLLRIGALDVVHAADQVLQEVALTLSGGTEQVRTPQGQGTRPVDGVVDVLNGELQVTGVQALCDVVRVRGSLAACHCLLCLLSQFQ